MLICSTYVMCSARLFGDEDNYAAAATAVARFISRRHGSLSEVQQRVVDNGWFMPGLSILLTPVALVHPLTSATDAWAFRLYMAFVNSILWAWSIRELYRVFGRWIAGAAIVFPAICLGWLVAVSMVTSELPAGLLLVVAFSWLVDMANRLMKGEDVPWGDIFKLETVFLAVVYLRGNFILYVVASHILLLLAVYLGAGPALVVQLKRLVLGVGVFVAALLPWSATVSYLLGSPIVTTSTMALSLGMTFGDRREICFGPCGGQNIWRDAADFSRVYAKSHGISQVEAQRQMSAYALRNLTLERYLEQVQRNLTSFFARPEGNSAIYLDLYRPKLSDKVLDWIKWLLVPIVYVVYFPFGVGFVMGNLLVFGRNRMSALVSLCIKGFSLCAFVQPFMHPSHVRYWVGFAPLMAIATGFVLQEAWAHHHKAPGAAPALPGREIAQINVLWFMQWLYVIPVLLVLSVLWVQE